MRESSQLSIGLAIATMLMFLWSMQLRTNAMQPQDVEVDGCDCDYTVAKASQGDAYRYQGLAVPPIMLAAILSVRRFRCLILAIMGRLLKGKSLANPLVWAAVYVLISLATACSRRVPVWGYSDLPLWPSVVAEQTRAFMLPYLPLSEMLMRIDPFIIDTPSWYSPCTEVAIPRWDPYLTWGFLITLSLACLIPSMVIHGQLRSSRWSNRGIKGGPAPTSLSSGSPATEWS